VSPPKHERSRLRSVERHARWLHHNKCTMQLDHMSIGVDVHLTKYDWGKCRHRNKSSRQNKVALFRLRNVKSLQVMRVGRDGSR
jgi:hypothetical protein